MSANDIRVESGSTMEVESRDIYEKSSLELENGEKLEELEEEELTISKERMVPIHSTTKVGVNPGSARRVGDHMSATDVKLDYIDMHSITGSTRRVEDLDSITEIGVKMSAIDVKLDYKKSPT